MWGAYYIYIRQALNLKTIHIIINMKPRQAKTTKNNRKFINIF